MHLVHKARLHSNLSVRNHAWVLPYIRVDMYKASEEIIKIACYHKDHFVSRKNIISNVLEIITWTCFSVVQIAFTPQGLWARQAILHLCRSQIFSWVQSSLTSHSIDWQPILSSLEFPKKPCLQEHVAAWLSALHSALRPQSIKSQAVRHSAYNN